MESMTPVKAVFVIGVFDSVAKRTGRALSNENIELLQELEAANNLDAEVVFAVEEVRFAGLERNVKLADIKKERERVVQQINEAGAELVFCFGKVAASSCFNRGSIVLSDYGRRAHSIDDIDCGRGVFVLDSLSRVAAQPGVRQWLFLDMKAACDGYADTEWGDYTILLPGTPEWDQQPDWLDVRSGDWVGFDLETYPGVDPWRPDSRIRMGMLAKEPGRAVVVQCGPGSSFPEWFLDVVRDPSITKCGSNISFDVKWMDRFGTNVQGVFDTAVAEHLIDETNPKKDLKALTFKYLPRLGDYSYGHRQLVKKRKGWEHVEDHEMYQYAGADAEASIAAALAQRDHIREFGIEQPTRLAMDLYPILTEMQVHGAAVDMDRNAEMEEAFDRHLTDLRRRITEELGPVNPASPAQLADALLKHIPGIDLRKGTFVKMWNLDDPDDPEDDISTARVVLEREAAKHPIIRTILEYRRWFKLYGTYVSGLREKHIVAHGNGDYVHPSFNQNRVETNRLSSSNPNLQNIPRKPGEDDPEILNVKNQFVSRFDGGQILEADFSQAELRVAAWVSGDKRLLNAYDTGLDVHTLTAANVWHGGDMDAVTPEQRQMAKTVNFLTIYGGGANTLSKQIGLPKDECKVVLRNFMAGYPGLSKYIKKIHAQVRRDLRVTSPFGFVRRFQAPPNNNWNCWEAWAVQRQAFNHIIQNTAACLTYCAIIDIYNQMRAADMKSLMFGTVHDSILFDVYPGEEEALVGLVRAAMLDPKTEPYGVTLGVPMEVDIEIGPSWGKKEEWNDRESC